MSENQVIETVSKISSSLGILGAVMTIPFFRSEQISLKTPIGKLTFIIWLKDFQDAFLRLIGNTPLLPIQSSYVCCTIQSVLGTFNCNVDIWANAVVGFWAFYLFYIGGNRKVLMVYQGMVLLAIYLISTIMAILPLFSRKMDLFEGVYWCWFSTNYAGYQFYTLYLWVWVVTVFNVFAASFTWYNIHHRQVGSRIIVRLFSYLLVYIIAWTPTSAYRISLYIYGSAPFLLTLLHYTVMPTRGLLHYICLLVGLQIKYDVVESSNLPGYTESNSVGDSLMSFKSDSD
ncbi:hypothetical protein HDV06_001176 [Boothiomyces sp. JEL0866]|nr:hypothetical protein HDV06_001176 [Boothiomyces sp. JEL0866]